MLHSIDIGGMGMKKKILLITPENEEINRFRKNQFNNFIQITMPYLALS